jgi:hypothetical protein
MNLPEYRRAYRTATERFQVAVSEAAEVLYRELLIADDKFFEDKEEAKAVVR